MERCKWTTSAIKRIQTSVRTYQELFLLLLRGLVVETTSLNDLVVDVELVSRTSKHGFLYALLSDVPQDSYNRRLTDTMRTILSLEISVRAPVTVEAIR